MTIGGISAGVERVVLHTGTAASSLFSTDCLSVCTALSRNVLMRCSAVSPPRAWPGPYPRIRFRRLSSFRTRPSSLWTSWASPDSTSPKLRGVGTVVQFLEGLYTVHSADAVVSCIYLFIHVDVAVFAIRGADWRRERPRGDDGDATRSRERESVIADMVSRHLGARMQETGSWPHPDYPFLFAARPASATLLLVRSAVGSFAARLGPLLYPRLLEALRRDRNRPRRVVTPLLERQLPLMPLPAPHLGLGNSLVRFDRLCDPRTAE